MPRQRSVNSSSLLTGSYAIADPTGGVASTSNVATFTAGGTSYTGRVQDFRMTLKSVVDGKPVEWTAVRR